MTTDNISRQDKLTEQSRACSDVHGIHCRCGGGLFFVGTASSHKPARKPVRY